MNSLTFTHIIYYITYHGFKLFKLWSSRINHIDTPLKVFIIGAIQLTPRQSPLLKRGGASCAWRPKRPSRSGGAEEGVCRGHDWIFLWSNGLIKGKSKPETIDFPIKHGVFHGFPAIFSLNQSIRFWGSIRGFHHGGSPIAGWCTLWNIHL